MELNRNSLFEKYDKSIIPTEDDILAGALVLYNNGMIETIYGHIRFFIEKENGYEWTAGSSDDVTHLVDCWFKKIN